MIEGTSVIKQPLLSRKGTPAEGGFMWSMSPDCRRVLVKELGVASRWSMYDLETQTVVPDLMPPEMTAADFLSWESTTSLEGYAESVGGAAMTGFRWNLTTHAGQQFDVSFAQPDDSIETTQ